MLLFWKIRYLDTRDREFKDRELWLDTNSLDPATKAAVEICIETGTPGCNREVLRFRRLFREEKYSKAELNELCSRCGGTSAFCLPDYFEDEKGNELTPERMGQALTGDPNTVMIPSGAKQHDINFRFAPKPSIDLSPIQLPSADLSAMSYFSRDLRELEASIFLIEGPGTLTFGPGKTAEVQTSVSEDEIRSFVTIFRRLYMAKEPGNFLKAAEAFAKAVLPHPVGEWIQGVAAEYKQALASVPAPIPFVPKGSATFTRKQLFTRKRLIDVFLYTQFAHQGEEKRERQYAECLAQVDQQRGLLFWLFLRSMWECALQVRNAGIQIASFTEHYCKIHSLTPSVVGPATEYIGMGELEKQRDREARVFREKAERLATTIWQTNGRPEGGPMQFIKEAREQLKAAMTGKIDIRKEVT